ncbi:acyl carrier protein [Anabaena sp. FACHB-1237]|uniref:acyl carrier protein n=1 Tax=Anabaena sp. FACHB-1237 TaxID=2692769 RepID=UPI0016804888|nr:acyl carrier protein [Anabaena sp. FACHB-1237]MBD2136216.1 acyl carrier protein [Anabaena sp. FACHB-1237]
MTVIQNAKKLPSISEVEEWIVKYIAELLEIEEDEVDTTIPFDRYGLDSSVSVGLMGDLATWLERDLEPTLMYDYPNIDTLVNYINVEILSPNSL